MTNESLNALYHIMRDNWRNVSKLTYREIIEHLLAENKRLRRVVVGLEEPLLEEAMDKFLREHGKLDDEGHLIS